MQDDAQAEHTEAPVTTEKNHCIGENYSSCLPASNPVDARTCGGCVLSYRADSTGSGPCQRNADVEKRAIVSGYLRKDTNDPTQML
jgi:hypothetical protein